MTAAIRMVLLSPIRSESMIRKFTREVMPATRQVIFIFWRYLELAIKTNGF